MQLRPVILCGGSGTRLWPLSRGKYPKQFMDLGGETLFGRTLERAASIEKIGRPLVVCNEDHRFFAAGILQTHGMQADILLEPEGRNTAPALALAALAALENAGKHSEDVALLVLPSDHAIDPVKVFADAVQTAMQTLTADPEIFMTFGILPTHPETGFGYLVPGEELESGAFRVSRFVEKPNLEQAEALLEAHSLWNGGIFLFRAKNYLDALRQFAPDILQACEQAWKGRKQDADFIRPEKAAFLSSPKNSIDYTVMERVAKVGMVKLSAMWSDLGSWEAFYAITPHDSNGNALRGDVIAKDTSNCYLHSTHRLLASLGVHNLAVIESADAVLVMDRSRSQDVKALLESMKTQGRSEAETHVRVFRPWGSYELISISERYQVKKITVRPGAALSLQLHYHRSEHWVVVKGTARVRVDDKETLINENQSVYIPLGKLHRLENPGCIPLELIEIQSGSYLGEDDIVRFEDRYGRLEEKNGGKEISTVNK